MSPATAGWLVDYENLGMAGKKRSRPQLLSSTRPAIGKATGALSSRRTRSIVRTHHNLRKQLDAATSVNDGQAVAELQGKIAAAVGLKQYQRASEQGQSADRGGDSSKILVDWFTETGNARNSPMRLLEVGALRVDNACSRSGFFEIERIDLRSQHPLIKEQDFMKRSTPKTSDLPAEGFDIISLSLVVNFVSNAQQRGDMLRRAGCFLRQGPGEEANATKLLPAIFLVLPAPCVMNSRYLDEGRLEAIMASLGYRMGRRKLASKLIYYLWFFDGSDPNVQRDFKKKEIRPGLTRNNFAIVLNPD